VQLPADYAQQRIPPYRYERLSRHIESISAGLLRLSVTASRHPHPMERVPEKVVLSLLRYNLSMGILRRLSRWMGSQDHMTHIVAGNIAPEFSLKSLDQKEYSLRTLLERGPVIAATFQNQFARTSFLPPSKACRPSIARICRRTTWARPTRQSSRLRAESPRGTRFVTSLVRRIFWAVRRTLVSCSTGLGRRN